MNETIKNPVVTEEEYVKLKMMNEELQARIREGQCENERLRGVIYGLKFAIRCNGVSGGEVHD